MAEIAYQGRTFDELSNALYAMQPTMRPGEGIEFALASTNPLSQAQAEEFANGLRAQGINCTTPVITNEGDCYMTTFAVEEPRADDGTTGVAWLVPLIGLISTALPLALIGFGITKIQAISGAIIPLVLAVGGVGVLMIALLRQPATKFAEAYARR